MQMIDQQDAYRRSLPMEEVKMKFLKPDMLPKERKSSPTTRLFAVVSVVAISLATGAAPANAHCQRHIYNKSKGTWHVTIDGQGYPNKVDFDIKPGETKGFWHVTGLARDKSITVYRKCPNFRKYYNFNGCMIEKLRSELMRMAALRTPKEKMRCRIPDPCLPHSQFFTDNRSGRASGGTGALVAVGGGRIGNDSCYISDEETTPEIRFNDPADGDVILFE